MRSHRQESAAHTHPFFVGRGIFPGADKSTYPRSWNVSDTANSTPALSTESRVSSQVANAIPSTIEPSLSQSTGHDFTDIPIHSTPPSLQTSHLVQPKLMINAPGDSNEREADQVAEQVMQTPEPEQKNSTESAVNEYSRAVVRNGLQRKDDGSDVSGGMAAPADVHQVLSSGGSQLDPSVRAYMEPRFGRDFGGVRVHTDNRAAESARGINARAYTQGNNVVFGEGQYAPDTAEGKRLIAHELTHVVQQGSAGPSAVGNVGRARKVTPNAATHRIQRDIAEAKLSKTPVEQIMADPNYFENGITKISFYSAELAILHYKDGSTIRLGLVPEYIKGPFKAVDYRTPRSLHIPVTSKAPSLGTGSISFIPRGRKAKFPAGTTAKDLPKLAKQVGRTIQFTHHSNGRIVPTEVNTISAPRLTKALRGAEAEYVRQFNAMSKGAVKILKKLEWIVVLSSFFGGLFTGGTRAAAGRTASKRAATGAAVGGTAAGRAQSTLTSFFGKLLKSGATEKITVEGVGFAGVRAATSGTELVVTRNIIVNASKIPGQGRLIHGAFEKAAIQVARQAGMKSARVSLELVQNPKWAAYLESHGYAFQVIAHKTGATRVLTKVFPL